MTCNHKIAMDFETTVKLHIYKTITETTKPPELLDVSSKLGASVQEVSAVFNSLSIKRLLVLEPGDSNRIRMAPPFSGIKTNHRVVIGDKSFYANCAWDALGISAALKMDASIESICKDCGEKMNFKVINGQPVDYPCAIHFAVPAAKWWDDIIYT